MRARDAALVATPLVALAVACVPSGAPRVPCPPTGPADLGIPAEAASAAARAGVTPVPCDDGEYGLVAPGARRRSVDELGTLRKEAEPRLTALEGVTMIGLGACCLASGRAFDDDGCIRITVDRGTPAVARIPEIVANLRHGDADVRVAIRQGPPREPRCAATDPACGPLPYEGEGCVDPGATRGWSRERVRSFRVEGQPAPCEHDGECVTCNTVCTSYRYRPAACTLVLATTLRRASCGCIDRGCAWFEMRP